MKKILLSTTAIVALAAVSTQASAADPISVKVGGFANQLIMISDYNSTTKRNIGLVGNNEIHFSGSTTLDNGLTVGMMVELEANRGGDSSAERIDRSYMTVSSDTMGAFTLGNGNTTDGTIWAPNAGYWSTWNGVGMMGLSRTTDINTGGDFSAAGGHKQISWASPSYSGVSVHATYAPDVTSGGNTNNKEGADIQDAIMFGANFDGEVSGAAVSASYTYESTNTTRTYNVVGLSATMAGLTVGGNYGVSTDDTHDAATGLQNSDDGKGYTIGAAYTTGATTVSGTYWNNKGDGTTTSGSDKDTVWSVAAAYNLGAGASVKGQYLKATVDGESDDAQTEDSITVGISVGF